MKRTLGAAIGAVIIVVFMSLIATRLTPQVSASSSNFVDASAVNP